MRIVEADAIFEATVSWIETRVRADQPHPQYLFTERIVHLRDVRSWRGEPAITIVTGMGGGDCGYEFKVGTRYLIAAYRGPSGELSTGICSKTQPLIWAGGFREYVEGLPSPSRGGHVWGRVVTPPRYSAMTSEIGHPEPDPLAGAKISVAGPTRRTVDVGPDGQFSVPALPPGEYTINVTLPPGRRDLKAVDPRTVKLDHVYACSDLSIEVEFSNEIAGRVIDESGAPVAGAPIDLLPVPRPASVQSLICVFTDDEGRYRIGNLPPGRYLAGVSVSMGPTPMSPFSPTYGRELSGESELQIPEAGGSFELQPMVVRRLTARRLRGTVTWADGRPAADLRIGGVILDPRGSIPAIVPARTSADGTFDLDLHEDLRYRLIVRQAQRVLHQVKVGPDEQTIAIILPIP